MTSDAIDGVRELLFPAHGGFATKDYLAFLAQRVPKNLADQLDHDGQPDIGMPCQTITVRDLVEPLSSGVFPTDNLDDFTNLLGYVLICQQIDLDEKNPAEGDLYKMIYSGSLYLHCFVGGGGLPPASGYPGGINVLVTASLRLDVFSRLQVCRFLASLVPVLPVGSTDEPAALSCLLLGLSLIIGSILGDVGVFTEHVMKSEFLAPEAEFREFAFEEIVHIKKLLVDVFGASGRVRHAADRFMAAVPGGECQSRDTNRL